MKLIEEQVSLLNLEKEQLTKEIKDIKSSIENMDTCTSLYGSYDETLGDLKKQIVANDIRIKKIDSVIKESQIIENPSIEKIDIGSHIELFIDFGDESDFQEENYLSFTLIEKTVGQESSRDFITLESSIGKAIFGKKAGDQFNYFTYNHQEMKGIIMSIGSIKENEKINIKKRNSNEN